eukprot:8683430-Lingulodinium_polyedra.AAC.1
MLQPPRVPAELPELEAVHGALEVQLAPAGHGHGQVQARGCLAPLAEEEVRAVGRLKDLARQALRSKLGAQSRACQDAVAALSEAELVVGTCRPPRA